jgi:hypothetical protein
MAIGKEVRNFTLQFCQRGSLIIIAVLAIDALHTNQERPAQPRKVSVVLVIPVIPSKDTWLQRAKPAAPSSLFCKYDCTENRTIVSVRWSENSQATFSLSCDSTA